MNRWARRRPLPNDSNGNQLTQTPTRSDESGNPVTTTNGWLYDANNQIVKGIDAEGGITITEYNAIKKRSSVTDKNGGQIEFAYDSAGNLIQTTFADGTTEIASYDVRR